MPSKNAVDEFLEDVNGKAEPGTDELGFPNNEDFSKELLGDEPTVEVKEEKEEEEKPLPFNKDPKVLKFIEKELNKRLNEFKTQLPDKSKEEIREESEDLVSAFTQIIGNDTPEKVHALKMLDKTVRGLEDKALSATRQLEAERQAEQEAITELESGLESIEETFNVDLTNNKKLRAEYLDFIERIAPKDEDGEVVSFPDFQESFKLFKEMKKPQPNMRAREIASKGMTRPSGTPEIASAQDYTWSGVEKMIARLTGK
jgi:hypothetical protein